MLRVLVLCAAFTWLAGCGYVGEIQPPALNIPRPVTDLTAVQRGDKIAVSFTIPALTTEGVTLKQIGRPEVQIGSKTVTADLSKPGHATAEFPAAEWIGQQPAVKVRVPGPKGRFSNWSNEVVVSVIEPLAVPSAIKAESAPKGVKVSWVEAKPRPNEQFRIQRKDNPQPSTATGSEYLDPEAKVGQEYEYRVQAVVGTSESEWSPYFKITPADTFPPDVPTGLTAIAGINSVEINWDPSTAEDLKGYRIYRSVENAAFEKAGEVETPAFSDKQVQPGKTYRYAVSAFDQLGNESARCAPIEIKLQ